MQATLAVADQILIAIYLGALLLLGFGRRGSAGNTLDYLLAGRKLTLFPFVATMVSTAYGWVLGIGELYYDYGISAWLFLSLPYSLFSILFALFFARKARGQQLVTLPDLLALRYGQRTASLGTLLILVLTSPAMYILMAAQVLHFLWGWPVLWCILFSTLFSMIYVLKGGFKAVVRTDVLQFLMMFSGFVILLLVLYKDHGTAALEQIEPAKRQWQISGSPWYVLSWFLFATITLADPNYHQRIYATDKPTTARTGLLVSVGFWTLFDFLAAATALYALHLLPGIENKAFLYLELGNRYLPTIAKSLFFLGILATIMSTSNSFMFTSALSLSKDLLHRNGWLKKYSIEKLTAFMLVLVAIAGMGVAAYYHQQSVVELFFDITPAITSALLFPVLFSYSSKWSLNGRFVFVQMATAFAVALTYKYFHDQLPELWKPITEVYPGLLVAILFQLTGWGLRKHHNTTFKS